MTKAIQHENITIQDRDLADIFGDDCEYLSVGQHVILDGQKWKVLSITGETYELVNINWYA